MALTDYRHPKADEAGQPIQPSPKPPPWVRVAAIATVAVIAVILATAAILINGGGDHNKITAATTSHRPGGTSNSLNPRASTTASTPGVSTPSSAAAATLPSGNTSWPAAQPNPPSLTGAMNTTDATAIAKTLWAYRDWVYVHPNPALVSNYMLSTSSDFFGDTKQLQTLVANRWHGSPNPSDIQFIGVKLTPRVVGQRNGKPLYSPALITMVQNFFSSPILDATGKPVITYPNKQVAYSISFSYGQDGQWRIADIHQLNPPGGIASVEKP